MGAIKNQQPAVLILEDGTTFHGNAVGATGTTIGEICFNTGMTGYQEIFTDPSYYGQILVMTTAHVGNYGAHGEEIESDSLKIAGLVVKNFSHHHSRRSAESSLQEYLERDNLTGISDIDTRELVRHIRDKGAMNAIISSEELDEGVLTAQLKAFPPMEGQELASKVTTKESYEVGNADASMKIAILDIGLKKNMVRCLLERGCRVKVFPMDVSLAEMKQWEPDGFLISNGPGDPAAMPKVVELVNQIIAADYPVFGICLGHQIIARSLGLKTVKMHNGHRGINHPVKNLQTGKCEMTSQNHGFIVDRASAEENDEIEVTHIHLNDNSLAGFRMKDKLVFSVQYHPESSPGPNDSRYLFDDFIANIVKAKESVLN